MVSRTGKWMAAAAALTAAIAFAGCAHKEQLQPDMGGQQQEQSESLQKTESSASGSGAGSGAAAIPTAIPTPGLSHFLVRKGDSLWKISSTKEVFDNPFRWPLLFKANRDQILDPDLIEPAQDLSFEKNYSPGDVEEAVAKAKETPPYHPHTTPRKRLPVKY